MPFSTCRFAVSVIALGALFTLSAHAEYDALPPDYSVLETRPPGPQSSPASLAAQETMITLPAGDYPMGQDHGLAEKAPLHKVSLAAFRMDKTEVTNAAYAEYLNALELELTSDFRAGTSGFMDTMPQEIVALIAEGSRSSGLYPLIALDDEQARIDVIKGRFVARAGFENHPVAETTWAGALAYCAWRGARLPSEAEWEAAARGLEGRSYPWGEAIPDETRVFVSHRSGVTGPVADRPAGNTPRGLADMGGSMAEWTSSLKRPYPFDASDGREDPSLPGERVTRGGDYIYDTSVSELSSTHRNGFSNAPHRGHRHIGFRCAG